MSLRFTGGDPKVPVLFELFTSGEQVAWFCRRRTCALSCVPLHLGVGCLLCAVPLVLFAR